MLTVRNIWLVDCSTEWLHWSVTVQLYTQIPASWAAGICVVVGWVDLSVRMQSNLNLC